MSQNNSDSIFSSDSDILYNLNIDQDLSEDDAGDSLDSDTNEINNIYDGKKCFLSTEKRVK